MARGLERFRSERVLLRTAEEEIHRGSFDGRPAVLRRLRTADPDAIVDEVRALAALSDPSLPALLDAGRDAEGVYLVRPWIDGTDLRSLGRQEPARVAEIVDGVAAALERVHAAGFLHLDVSPGNVVVREDGSVALLDFGLARREGTPIEDARGSAYFVAPEVILGLPVDARADLFSVGALATRLLAGPFETPVDAFYARFPAGEFLAAAGIEETRIDPAWKALLRQLVAREPAERLADAASLRRALRRALPALTESAPLERPAGIRLDAQLWRGAALQSMRTRLLAPIVGDPRPRLRVECEDPSALAEVATDLLFHARLGGAVAHRVAADGADVPRAALDLARGLGFPQLRLPSLEGLGEDEARDVLARFAVRAVREAASDRPVWILRVGAGKTAVARWLDRMERRLGETALPRFPAGIVSLRVAVISGSREDDDVVVVPGPDARRLEEALARAGLVGAEGSVRRVAERLLAGCGPDTRSLEESLAAAFRSGALRAEGASIRIAGSVDPTAGRGAALAGLGEPALRLVTALAALGRSCPRPRASALAGAREAAISGAIEELLAARLAIVVREGVGARMEIASEATRRAVLEEIPEEARREAHRRALSEIRRSDAPPEDLARVAAGAGEHTEAIEAALRAVGDRDRGLPAETALPLLDHVLALAPEGSEAAFELLDRRSEIRGSAGDGEGSASDAEALVASAGRDPVRRARALVRRAECALRRGDRASARADLEAASRDLPRATRDLVDRHARTLAAAFLAEGEHGAAVQVLDAALRQEGLDAASEARLRVPLSVALAQAGDVPRSEEEAARALALCRATEDLPGAASALVNLGFARERLGRGEAAVAALGEARDLFRRLGRATGEANAAHHLGIALRRAGERVEAERCLREALAMRERLGDAPGVAATRGSLGVLHAERGELPSARRELAEAASAFETLGARREEARARALLAEVLVEASRLDEARIEVDLALATQEELGLASDLRETRVTAARVALHAGDAAGARRCLGPAADREPAPARLVRIEIDLAQGDAESARARAEALRASEPSSRLVRDGIVDLLLARALVRLGRAEEASMAYDRSARAARARRAHHVALRAAWEAAAEELRRGAREASHTLWREGDLALDRIRLAEGIGLAPVDVLGPGGTEPSAALSRAFSSTPAPMSESPSATPPQPHRPTRAAREGPVPNELLRTFLAINKRLNTAVDREQLLRFILDSAIALSGARRGFLALYHGERLEVEVASATDRATIPAPARELSKSVVAEAVRTGRPILTSNARSDERFAAHRSVASLDLRSVVCVPFRTEEGLSGALYLDNPLREGAFDEGTIDLVDALADQAAIALTNLMRRAEILRLNDQLSDRLRERERALAVAEREIEVARRRLDPPRLVAASARMREVLDLLDRVAATDVPVLLLGESGTGKDLVAHELHRRSLRRAERFVTHNCAATPEALMESEFFGHVRGSFTGADRDRVGLVELAHRGTLLLDEIGEMPLSLQAKVLRFLQGGEYRPVGATTTRHADVRIVSATNRSIQDAVREGTFREDLLYRLRGVAVTLPPLRERPEDVPLLVDAFLARCNEQQGARKRMTEQVRRALATLPWPGNVRELEHEVARLFFLSGDTIDDPTLLSAGSRIVGEGSPAGTVRPLRDLERDAIEAALRATGGNRDRAARQLGISRTTIYEKIRAYRLAAHARAGSKSSPPRSTRAR